jgi:hypothetical protein
MGKMNLLMIGLGISVVIYVIYRHTFLKSPKNKIPPKPHYTLKIESE